MPKQILNWKYAGSFSVLRDMLREAFEKETKGMKCPASFSGMPKDEREAVFALILQAVERTADLEAVSKNSRAIFCDVHTVMLQEEDGTISKENAKPLLSLLHFPGETAELVLWILQRAERLKSTDKFRAASQVEHANSKAWKIKKNGMKLEQECPSSSLAYKPINKTQQAALSRRVKAAKARGEKAKESRGKPRSS